MPALTAGRGLTKRLSTPAAVFACIKSIIRLSHCFRARPSGQSGSSQQQAAASGRDSAGHPAAKKAGPLCLMLVKSAAAMLIVAEYAAVRVRPNSGSDECRFFLAAGGRGPKFTSACCSLSGLNERRRPTSQSRRPTFEPRTRLAQSWLARFVSIDQRCRPILSISKRPRCWVP